MMLETGWRNEKWEINTQGHIHFIGIPYTILKSYTITEWKHAPKYHHIRNNTPVTFSLWSNFWLKIGYFYWAKHLKVYTRFLLTQESQPDVSFQYQPKLTILSPSASLDLPLNVPLEFSLEFLRMPQAIQKCCIYKINMTFHKEDKPLLGEWSLDAIAMTSSGECQVDYGWTITLQTRFQWSAHFTGTEYHWQLPFYLVKYKCPLVPQILFRMSVARLNGAPLEQEYGVTFQYREHLFEDDGAKVNFTFYPESEDACDLSWEKAKRECQNRNMKLPILANDERVKEIFSQFLQSNLRKLEALSLNIMEPSIFMIGLLQNNNKVILYTSNFSGQEEWLVTSDDTITPNNDTTQE